jgi:predicted nucleic acid-binding protein
MRLAVDASSLVAEVLRERGRALLGHEILDLIIAAEAWDETQHELRRRVDLIEQRGLLDSTSARQLLQDALTLIASRVTVANPEIYSERMEEALRRVPRDVHDAPTIASALTLNCGIWTNDRDFFGCGVPVWTTDTLQSHLIRSDADPSGGATSTRT